jgi:hypothetical protein
VPPGAAAAGAAGAAAAAAHHHRQKARRARAPKAAAAADDGFGADDHDELIDGCRADDADCAFEEGTAGPALAAAAAPPPPPLKPLPGQQLSFTAYDSELSSEVTRCEDGVYHVRVTGPPGAALVLHWGCNNWELPPAAAIPPGSEQAGDRAVRTPFDAAAGAAAVTLRLPESVCPERLVFVVHDTESDVWIRDHSANFSLPLRCAREGLFIWGGGRLCFGSGALGVGGGVVRVVEPRRAGAVLLD